MLDVGCEQIFTPAQEVISISLRPEAEWGKYHPDIPEGVDLKLIFRNLITLAFHFSTDLRGVGGNAKCNKIFYYFLSLDTPSLYKIECLLCTAVAHMLVT